MVGLIEKGAFVEFGERALRGLPAGAPAARLVDAERAGHRARGEGSGRRLRLGDSVKVEVDRVDAPRGRVDLIPAESYS